MAPNRKNVAGLLQNLSNVDLLSLQSAIQPKFLPLTHPLEESKHLVEQKQQQQQQLTGSAVIDSPKNQITAQSQDVASYWDWIADVPAVEEHTTIDIFSASRIEANLIRDAAIREASSSEVVKSNLIAAHDDYWAEADHQQQQVEQKVVQAQHVDASYWEWPTTSADFADLLIRRIFTDEVARQMTSASVIERVEMGHYPRESSISRQQVAATRECNDGYWQWNSVVVAPHVGDHSHPMANYWDEEDREEREPTKESAIQAILEYEIARELLSSETIVRHLMSAEPASSSGTNASSDEYWAYSEHLGDEYWQTNAVPIVSSHSVHYWDW